MNTPGATRDVLRDILRIGSRYVLAGALFQSGMRMVLNLAGIHTGPVEWITPLGEFSGAQFAGIWLGVSPLFQTLGGLVEVAAGFLLLSRRTTTLGAMMAVGCFTNSLMLHLCFRPSPWAGDAILLALSSYLVLLDWHMLVDLLLLDRPTTPIPTEGTWETPLTRKIGLILKAAVLLYFVYASGFRMILVKQDAEAQSELSGAYSVAAFSPANADLQHRWRVAAIDRYAERLAVRTMDGNGTTFQIQLVVPQGASSREPDSHREHAAATTAPSGRITLVAPNGLISVLNYSRLSAGHLVLEGELDGVATVADLHLIPPAGLPLVNKEIYFPEPR